MQEVEHEARQERREPRAMDRSPKGIIVHETKRMLAVGYAKPGFEQTRREVEAVEPTCRLMDLYDPAVRLTMCSCEGREYRENDEMFSYWDGGSKPFYPRLRCYGLTDQRWAMMRQADDQPIVSERLQHLRLHVLGPRQQIDDRNGG